jgi:hypothetical protein
MLLYYCTDINVLDLFHILWCQPVLDLWNVNKFNSIQFCDLNVQYNSEKLLIFFFQKCIHDFLQRPDIQLLVLAGSTSGLLQPMHSFPSACSRSKSCYFIKKAAEPVTKENFRSILIFGDIGAKPVDELAVLVQEVLLCDFRSYQFINFCKHAHMFQQYYI